MHVQDHLSPGEHTFQTKSNFTLSYTTSGTGPLIVAQTPGWGIGPSYVRAAWAPIEKSYTVLTFCPRGTPPSSRPETESQMSSEAMAEDLESLRVHLAIEKMTLVGTSNGACIALYYAARYPKHVERLVVVGLQLVGFKDAENAKRIESERAGDAAFTAAMKTANTVVPKSDAELHQFLLDILPIYVVNPERDAPKFAAALSESMSIWCADAQEAADEVLGQREPQAEELRPIEARTLIVHGDGDYACPVTAAEKVSEVVKGSRFVRLMCGHFPWLEAEESYWEEVEAFLRESR